MIEAVTWETAHLHGEAWISQHRLRHRLFVQRQNWDVPTFKELEYDQFDTPAAVYLVWRDEDGEARGVTRLVPTTRPYMLEQVFPHLITREPLPKSPRIWEATRVGVDRDLPPDLRAQVCAEIVAGCLEYGLQQEIERYVFLMPLFIIKSLLTRSGCPVTLMGEPQMIDGHLCAAADVSVTPAVLAEVRRRKALLSPVLWHHSAMVKAA
jgi:N-acyl-L-homoserine lactone synthetase